MARWSLHVREPAHDGDVNLACDGEVEPAHDGEVDLAYEGYGELTKDGEVEPAHDGEVEPADAEMEPTNGGEVAQTKDDEMEPATASKVGVPATAIAMAGEFWADLRLKEKPRLRTPPRMPRRMAAPPTSAPPAHLRRTANIQHRRMAVPPRSAPPSHLLIQMPDTTARINRDFVRERDLARDA